MKIIFFCSSLAAGRDGVGDYTLRLADECAARGHACCVISLHDPFVERVTDLTPDKVRLIRLPASTPWSERLDCARQHLKRLAPDWVSWQIVSYGFHPRGFLPAELLRSAESLRGIRCHVMLHELWLGLEQGSTWKARFIGWLQRRGVLSLLSQLDPDHVQTSCAVYQKALIREGVDVSLLGLFGNIPITNNIPQIKAELAQWLPAKNEAGSPDPLVAVTFGTLHPQWQPAASADWFIATARRLNRTPVLIAIGRTGSHATLILDSFRERGIRVIVTADLETENVSALLAAADLGIAAHPWALIGKSGAATAMLEHGLPVLVPRDDWQLRGFSEVPFESDPLLTRLNGLEPSHTDRWLAARRIPKSKLPEIAESFLETIVQGQSLPAESSP